MKILLIFSIISGGLVAHDVATTTAATTAATVPATSTTEVPATISVSNNNTATSAPVTVKDETSTENASASPEKEKSDYNNKDSYFYNIYEVSGVMTSDNLVWDSNLADNTTVTYIAASKAFCLTIETALKSQLGGFACRVDGFSQGGATSRRKRGRRSTTYKTDIAYTNTVVSSASDVSKFETEYAAALNHVLAEAALKAAGVSSVSVVTPVKSSKVVKAGDCLEINGQKLCGGAGRNVFGILVLMVFGRYFL